jgi:hypothetical protein
MSDSSPSLSPESQGSSSDLQSEVRSLRGLINWLLFATLLLTFCGAGVMWVQLLHLRQDVNQLRPSVETMIKNYNDVEKPMIGGFVNQLVVFSKTSPDFVPVLVKYKALMPTAATAPQTAAPTNAAATKK